MQKAHRNELTISVVCVIIWYIPDQSFIQTRDPVVWPSPCEYPKYIFRILCCLFYSLFEFYDRDLWKYPIWKILKITKKKSRNLVRYMIIEFNLYSC